MMYGYFLKDPAYDKQVGWFILEKMGLWVYKASISARIMGPFFTLFEYGILFACLAGLPFLLFAFSRF